MRLICGAARSHSISFSIFGWLSNIKKIETKCSIRQENVINCVCLVCSKCYASVHRSCCICCSISFFFFFSSIHHFILFLFGICCLFFTSYRLLNSFQFLKLIECKSSFYVHFIMSMWLLSSKHSTHLYLSLPTCWICCFFLHPILKNMQFFFFKFVHSKHVSLYWLAINWLWYVKKDFCSIICKRVFFFSFYWTLQMLRLNLIDM